MKQIVCLKKTTSTKTNYITANQFLKWADEDLKEGSDRGLGNALGNIKRGLHFRIDEIIGRTNILLGNNKDTIKNTPSKLKVLKMLNMPYRAIAQNITDKRNSFEHDYILPKKEEIEGYYDAAFLWLEKSYRDYDFQKVALVLNSNNNKPTLDDKHKITNKCNFDFYWYTRTKKEIHEMKNGNLKVTKFSDYSWEDLLNYQKKSITQQYSNSNIQVISLEQRAITSLYKKLLKYNNK